MSGKDESIEIETVHGVRTKIPSKWLNKEGKKSTYEISSLFFLQL